MEGGLVLRHMQTLDPLDENDFKEIAHMGRSGKNIVKLVVENFDEAIRSAHDAHSKILRLRNAATEKFEEAETLSKAMLAKGRLANPSYEAPGVTFSEVWTADIMDETLIPREYLTPDLSKIKQVAKAMKKETAIPGVRVKPTIQVAYRADE